MQMSYLCLQLARADLIILSQREIEDLFSTLQNSPFPLAQNTKLHISALVLSPCFIPRHRCEKSEENLAFSPFVQATLQRLRENPRPARGSARVFVARMAQFVLKIEKIVPYHRCAQRADPKTYVSVPDYTS